MIVFEVIGVFAVVGMAGKGLFDTIGKFVSSKETRIEKLEQELKTLKQKVERKC
jgi:hypothetical protein